MRQARTLVLGAALALAVSCGRQYDEFAEATPDLQGLALEISGATSEGAALTSAEGVGQQGLDSNAPELLKHARESVGQLNAYVKRAVEPIAELIATENGKMAPGDSRVYGPKDRGNATYRLTIRRQSADRFTWALEAKALGGADTAYKIVAAGALTKGELPHRGRGVIGLDVDALKSVDASVKGAGKLLCAFAHVGEHKALIYRLKGFTPDLSAHDPIDAAFVGHRLMPSRATRVRLAARVNLADSPTDAKELVRARVRFIPGVGGRADVLATGGDVPEGKVYFGSACWDAQESEGFAILRVCVQGQPGSCQVVATRGQLSNCKPGVETEELPVEDPQDATAESGAPADGLVPPSSMPEP